MNYSGYNNQQQYAYAYDPSSQIQSYDQSYLYQPYYAYTPQQYAYFPSYAHPISDSHQPHLQFQPDSTPVHPPGVNPTDPEPAPPRATHAPTGPSEYRGRGGRGGRPFRGGGRGRGRGLNVATHFPSHSSGSAISIIADAPAAAGATSVVQPSSSVSGQTTPKPAHVRAAPAKPPLPPRNVRCEICNVECNTPEMLEQHKKGKRHQKNMKVPEELQRRQAINGQQGVLTPNTQLNLPHQPKQVQESEKKGCLTANMDSEVTSLNGQQIGLIPSTQLNLTDQPKLVQESVTKGCPTTNMGSEVTADNHKDEKELQNNVGQTSEVPAEEPAGTTIGNSAVRGRGLKRKMRGGRGCKYTRTNDWSRGAVEPPRPQQATSFICELCNVKCESQVVYQSHLAGKKHLARLKRGHGGQALSTVGLQALYPPDIIGLTNAINAQVQQGDSDPQVLLAQLLMTLLSQAQVPATAPLSSSPAAAQIPALASVAGSSYEPQSSRTRVSEITANVEMENPTGGTKNQLSSVSLESDDLAGSINALSNLINVQIQQGVSDPQVLLAQLLMTFLSQAQVPAITPPSGPVPAPISMAESRYDPQSSQTKVPEITPLELDALAGSSSGTQVADGSSETEQQVLKHPQDSSGMTPADNSASANDQIPSECEAPTS